MRVSVLCLLYCVAPKVGGFNRERWERVRDGRDGHVGWWAKGTVGQSV